MVKYYLYCISIAKKPTECLAKLVYGPFDTAVDALEAKDKSEHGNQYTIEELPCETLEEAVNYYSKVDNLDQSLWTELRPFNSLEEVLKFDALREMFVPPLTELPWYKRWFWFLVR